MVKRQNREFVVAPIPRSGGIANAADKAYVESTTQSRTLSGMWTGLWPYGAPGTALTHGGNLARVTRAYIQQSITDVALEVTTGGATTLAVALYRDTGTAPDTLVVATSAIDVSTTGIKQAPLVAPAGWYWVGVHNLSATAVTLRMMAGHNPYSVGSTTPLTTLVLGAAWSYSVTGTPPATLPAPASQNNSMPLVYIKVA